MQGKLGGLVAGTLFILPSAAILLAFSVLYVSTGNRRWLAELFAILNPVVVALVLHALLRLGRRVLTSLRALFVASTALISMVVFHRSAPAVFACIVGLAAIHQVVRRWREKGFGSMLAKTQGTSLLKGIVPISRIITAWLLVAALPVILISVVSGDRSFWLGLCTFFLQTAFVTFGGSYTVLPYVAHAAVGQFAWLSHAQMTDGFSLAESTPGPLIIVVGFVGLMAGFHHTQNQLGAGVIAFVLTLFYTFSPCFLFVFVVAPWVERTETNSFAAPILTNVTPVVVASMAQLFLFLFRGAFLSSPFGWNNLRAVILMVLALLFFEREHLGRRVLS